MKYTQIKNGRLVNMIKTLLLVLIFSFMAVLSHSQVQNVYYKVDTTYTVDGKSLTYNTNPTKIMFYTQDSISKVDFVRENKTLTLVASSILGVKEYRDFYIVTIDMKSPFPNTELVMGLRFNHLHVLESVGLGDTVKFLMFKLKKNVK